MPPQDGKGWDMNLMLEPRVFLWDRLQIPVTENLHLELRVPKHGMF